MSDTYHGYGKSRGRLIYERPPPQSREFADGVTSIDLHFLKSRDGQRRGPSVTDAGHAPPSEGPLADEHPLVNAGARE